MYIYKKDIDIILTIIKDIYIQILNEVDFVETLFITREMEILKMILTIIKNIAVNDIILTGIKDLIY